MRKTLGRESEEQLWHSWVGSNKHPDQLRPLLQSLQPLVQQTVNKYRTADVSHPALQAHTENKLVEGLNTYNPTKGSLSTHLNWKMRDVGRFVEAHQNFARIPGSRIRSIGAYQKAQAALQTELGRAPTLTELARRSKLPQKQVGLLQRELQPVHLMGLMTGETGESLSDFGGFTFNADRERLELIYPELSPQEQLVVDYSLGRAGKPKITSTSELARKMGVTAARISNIRNSIATKTKRLEWIR